MTLTPPDASHDWVLHISREGHKAGMLKSYKFDSRDPPFELQDCGRESGQGSVRHRGARGRRRFHWERPVHFQREAQARSKALRAMMYEWTGEVTVSERSYRVIGTGAEGTFNIPANIAADYPAALHVKVTAMNGLGKVYIVDRNYTLNK